MKAKVSLLTNHTRVIVALHQNPDIRQREIAASLQITEGAVQRILRELIEAGCVVRTRVGRRNHYQVSPAAQLRHPAAAGAPLHKLLDMYHTVATSRDQHQIEPVA